MRVSFIAVLFTGCLLSQTAYGQSWKNYPYHEDSTLLTFPADEGYHPAEPVEWWYATGHLIGDSTGTDYSVMFTFFHFDTTILGMNFQGFRIFNLANDNLGEFYDETLPISTYSTLAQTHLELKAPVGFPLSTHPEEFTTMKDTSGNLIPFEYHVKATQANGSIDLTYKCLKRPLVLGDNGFFYQGITGYTYYYSLVMNEVTGTITYKGVTETVHGTGWIDRQWGQFNPFNGEKYEWFSVQLSNGMAMNIWNIFNTANEIPLSDTYRLCSVYKDDSTDLELHDFTFDRLQFNWTADSVRCYSKQWHFVSNGIDIIISAQHDNHEVHLPFRFYEGTTNITGTVNGYPVTGVGFAECLHSYAKPQVLLTAPVEGGIWNEAQPITWQLTNPDSGRAVYYDVEYSTDNYSFTKIAHALTDTSYAWDAAGLSAGAYVWLKVIGYSVDSTLVGAYTMSNNFSYEPTGIFSASSASLSIRVYPNPSNGMISFISPAGASQLKIYNCLGEEVFKKTLEIKTAGEQTNINLSGLPADSYLAKFTSDANIQSFGRFLLVN